jgi:hypothetical protein
MGIVFIKSDDDIAKRADKLEEENKILMRDKFWIWQRLQ